jgi:poly(A) polymerase
LVPPIEPTILSPSGIQLSLLDQDAVRATQRLSARGFDAYLVGGCVRDMLLGLKPKDYDIATAASPPQVKRTFPRNCRIIGRRFKLAHLHFDQNQKILELSTFRRTPQAENTDDDLLIKRDNEFGTAEEDALRRDFTVNALFLDPTKDRILDYANGLADVNAKIIRTIGDPRIRFREDPIRILRAAKFAGRLGFTVEPGTLSAMAETSSDLMRAAPPRLLEEILRLLRSGHALDSFQLLRDVGALQSLLPVTAKFLGTAALPQRVHFWRTLEALDLSIHQGHVPSNPVLLGTLFSSMVTMRAEQQPTRSPSSVAEELLGPVSFSLRLPRRDAGGVKRICGVQHRFLQLNSSDTEKRFKVIGFLHGPYFEEALELFELRTKGMGLDPATAQSWRDLLNTQGRDRPADVDFDAAEDDDYLQSDGPLEPGDTEADPSAEGTDPAVEGTPPAAAQDDNDGRRRHRRRGRRGRGRNRDQDGDAPMQQGAHLPVASDSASDLAVRPTGAAADFVAPLSHRRGLSRKAPLASSQQPENPSADQDQTSRDGNTANDGTANDGVESDGVASPDDRNADGAPDSVAQGASEADGEQGGLRRRRRRRRGRGRSNAAQDLAQADPVAGELAPGEPNDNAAHPSATDGGEPSHAQGRSEQGRSEQGRSEQGRSEQGRSEQGRSEQGPSSRRRGGQRNSGQRDSGQRDSGQRDSGQRDSGQRDSGQRDSGQRDSGQRDSGQPSSSRRGSGQRSRGQRPINQQDAGQDQSGQQDSNQGQSGPRQQPPRSRGQRSRDDQVGGRRGRRERDDRSGRPGGRDVDVVPRHVDRRGKVDVIEPPPLDLSAFDVELDPRRVPTFGSIVEGKGRPKRRGPRVPEDDEYRPPPPPGGLTGPETKPPPPPSQEPDTFGDW